MRVTIRQIGNSPGFVVPKPLLAQLGFEGEADMTVEGDTSVLRKRVAVARSGWAEATRRIAEDGDDTLVMGEFANDDDPELAW